MRLIDADALLYDLEIVPLTGDGGVDINDLEDIVKLQPTIKARPTEWIPCEERLPDIEQDVLATTTLFGVREVTFAWRINDGEWLIREGSSEATNNDILAWMPLPKPYKGGESDV